MSTAILILCLISAALYSVGMIVGRSYDDSMQRAGIASVLIGIVVFALTGVLSTGYVLWNLLT